MKGGRGGGVGLLRCNQHFSCVWNKQYTLGEYICRSIYTYTNILVMTVALVHRGKVCPL